MFWQKYLKFFVLCLLAIAIIWYFGSSLDWSEVGHSLQKANVSVLMLATSVICFGYLLRALRWRTLLAPITETNLRELFATTTIGFAAVFLFGRTGEVVRPLWLPMRDPRVRPVAALISIGIERIFDLTALVLLFALNLLWFQAPAGREADFVFVNRIGLLLVAATFFGIVSLIVFQRYSKPIIGWANRHLLSRKIVPVILAEQANNLLDHLAASLQILRNWQSLWLTIFWTTLLWFSISIPTWLIILAFNLQFTFSDALFVMGWATVGSLVPTPGGAAGAFHTTTAAALIFMHVNREDAAAVAIIMHLIYFAPALFFGVYYFVRGDVSWARIRSLVIVDQPVHKSQLVLSGKIEDADYPTAKSLQQQVYE